jgi:hypothetical protein
MPLTLKKRASTLLSMASTCPTILAAGIKLMEKRNNYAKLHLPIQCSSTLPYLSLVSTL